MNIELLTKLAEWLEAGAPHEYITFDMNEGIAIDVHDFDPDKDVTQCRTSCCVAGAAVMLYNDPKRLFKEHPLIKAFDGSRNANWEALQAEAKEVLGLNRGTARELFTPHGDLRDYNDPAWAARTIRHLIETGEANWDATK